MVSFYHLASTVVQHPVHKLLKAAYLFYCASSVVPMRDLIHDALILAKKVTNVTTWLSGLGLITKMQLQLHY